MEMVSGQCLSVQVAGEDMTDSCTGVIGVSEYTDGRRSVYFMMSSKHVLVMSGMPKTKRSGGAQGFAVDKVVFNTGSSSASKVVTATGHCAYRAFGKKSVTVRCSGKLSGSASYVAAFRTQGTEDEQKSGETADQ